MLTDLDLNLSRKIVNSNDSAVWVSWLKYSGTMAFSVPNIHGKSFSWS